VRVAQVTISEVRPNGNETFVQNGWLRASDRKLSTDSNNMFKRKTTTSNRSRRSPRPTRRRCRPDSS
jgi:hypothetical protein